MEDMGMVEIERAWGSIGRSRKLLVGDISIRGRKYMVKKEEVVEGICWTINWI